MAAIALRRSGVRLAGDLVMESTCGEEVGDHEAGITPLIGAYRADGVVITEPTAPVARAPSSSPMPWTRAWAWRSWSGRRSCMPCWLWTGAGWRSRRGGPGRAIRQWRKWRLPVKTMAMWCRSATSIAISSRLEPPGWMTADTPRSAASWIASANGK